MKTLGIVVPIYNEESNIHPLYERVMGLDLANVFEIVFFFVNDGSRDNSADVLSKLAQEKNNVRFLNFSRNFGHQAALTAGLKNADADLVVMMDADLQHPPRIIPELVKHWKDGYDVVYTVRKYNEKISWFKKTTSSLYYNIINKLTKIDIKSGAADFRLWDKKVLDSFKEIKERNIFLRGLSVWLGFKQKEVHFECDERFSGQSSYNLKKMLMLALDGVTSFSSFPLHASLIIGIFFVALGFLWGGHVFYLKLFTNDSVQGWASQMILMILIGGIQIMMLGVIGIYLAKIHDEVKQRPMFVIQSYEGFDQDEKVTPISDAV